MKLHWLLLLVLPFAACDKKQEATSKSASEAEIAPAEETAAPEDPKKPEVDRDELARQALARVPEIQEGVAELRDLAFTSKVPAEYQSSEDFRAFVEREIQRELPPEHNEKLGKALTHLGLLAESMDLAKTLEDAMVSQAGAYYDPAQKKFFLVMVMDNKMMLDTISSHELTHALQDQHFDLKKYYLGHDGDGPPALSEDEMNARRFIVEGEATFLMVAYSAFSMAKTNILEEPHVKGLRAQLDTMANMDIESLVAMNKSQAEQFAGMGPEIQASIEAMDQIPLYILVPLLESYMKGTLPVYEAYVAGGWAGVGELYTTPPNSTEQVLHPAEKLTGKKRDYPIGLSFAAPKGWDEVHSEVIGELGWRVYFMQWEGKEPTTSAAGWDGDRLTVYEKDGQLVGLVATTWDTPADAEEFEKAYRESLEKRFPSGARENGTKAFIKRTGQDVYIVDGASDDSLLKLLSKTKKKKHAQDK